MPEPMTQALAALGEELFERWNPYEGDGFRNHCLRLHHIVQLLGRHEGIEFDPGLSKAIAMVHDLGLVCPRNLAENYLVRSWALWEDATSNSTADLRDAAPARLVRECLTLNHRLAPVPGCLPQAELFRRAVWVEHTRGLKRYGAPAREVRAVFQRYPRRNLDRVLLDFWWRTARHEPRTIAQGILF